ncbi:hypothetical protein CQY20_23105 [Mycolicibacterium agri]|uniref:MFS transporter n=1 Tax=Mycolicibacterium agri TaxID=36811 RepID=A0A2A7MTP5_MYCAG|nr:hypothetical protein CQY20_23105 [Mycolicibacterium agri]
MRGTAAGLLTATLAVAAHGLAGSAAPTGTSAALLAVLAVTVGSLAASIARTSDARVLLALLAAGQLAGHLMLSAAGHSHGGDTATVLPAPAMLAAHAMAVVVGALLIAAGDHLCRAVSRVVGSVARVIVPPTPERAVVTICADQPMHSALLLAASMSHRGPPVSPAR